MRVPPPAVPEAMHTATMGKVHGHAPLTEAHPTGTQTLSSAANQNRARPLPAHPSVCAAFVVFEQPHFSSGGMGCRNSKSGAAVVTSQSFGAANGTATDDTRVTTKPNPVHPAAAAGAGAEPTTGIAVTPEGVLDLSKDAGVSSEAAKAWLAAAPATALAGVLKLTLKEQLLGEFPEELKLCTKLKHLDISQNQLPALPDDFGTIFPALVSAAAAAAAALPLSAAATSPLWG